MTHHTTRLPAAYLVDGISHPVFPMAPDPSWPPLAEAKGFDFVARVTDRYRCLLRCHACGTNAVVRINVVRDHQPLCHACIYSRRAARGARDIRSGAVPIMTRSPQADDATRRRSLARPYVSRHP